MALSDSAAPLRSLVCSCLGVPEAACQLAILPAIGPPGQPDLNLEVAILPGPDRTRDRLGQVARELQKFLRGGTGRHAAVRFVQLDPETYVALK